ncbi:hypothetical protein BKA62DRAFT_28792 [Auriculariales sp. MPI-PUGE-AT-0066]|nr:hypothetical protein BKA62DRAFT_28792 [Auriculariales sp. MPI-PUGE-AT-0066]
MVAPAQVIVKTSPSLFLSQESVKSADSDFDIHRPEFISTIPHILLGSLETRQGGDARLHALVKAAVDSGVSDEKRLYLVEDEMRYRRNEEVTVLLHISKLITRLTRSSDIDIDNIDSILERQRATEAEQLQQIRVVEDMRRRVESDVQRVTRTAGRERVRELQVQRRYPGSPDGTSLTNGRGERNIPRRRFNSSATPNVRQAAVVFQACDRISGQRQRQNEAEYRSHANTVLGADEVAAHADDASSDEEDYGTELVIRGNTPFSIDDETVWAPASLILGEPSRKNQDNDAAKVPGTGQGVSIHGNLPETMRIVRAATPQRKRVLLDELKQQWDRVRKDVDRAVNDWDSVKKTIASTATRARTARKVYDTMWASFEAREPPTTAISFEEFPWPLVFSPQSVTDISAAAVADFLFHRETRSDEKVQVLKKTLALWQPENIGRLGIMSKVASRDRQMVAAGQTKVIEVLRELGRA